MLLTIGIILLIAYLLGLIAFKITAGFIHLVVIVAVILIIMHFVRGGKRV